MKRTIRLTEQELNKLVASATKQYIAESKNYKKQMNEEVDEHILGMVGGLVGSPIIKFVVNIIARALNLDQNGVLYRVLTSKLFAMALGNEIENSMKLHKQEGEKPMNGLNGGMFDANGNGSIDLKDILAILGIRNGNIGSETTGSKNK